MVVQSRDPSPGRPQFRSSSGGAEGALGVDGHAERTRCVEGCVGGPTELHGHIRPSFPRIMCRYGLRGVLVGEASHPGPISASSGRQGCDDEEVFQKC